MTKEQRNALRTILNEWDVEKEVCKDQRMMSFGESLKESAIGRTYEECAKQLRKALKENFDDWSENPSPIENEITLPEVHLCTLGFEKLEER